MPGNKNGNGNGKGKKAKGTPKRPASPYPTRAAAKKMIKKDY
tara:strand:+ start:620 stop:745 length:126 start_codon:yes stop_codon:yes gene_type:complete